jgi:hypothetical protein
MLVALIPAMLVFAACDEGDEEADRACEGTALSSGGIQLPADFPIPSEAVLTSSSEAGPSQVVDGYYEGSLESAYEEWKAALEGADYAILFDEIETDDSEISYRSPDEASTGQIALRAECEEEGRIFVHITNRPA